MPVLIHGGVTDRETPGSYADDDLFSGTGAYGDTWAAMQALGSYFSVAGEGTRVTTYYVRWAPLTSPKRACQRAPVPVRGVMPGVGVSRPFGIVAVRCLVWRSPVGRFLLCRYPNDSPHGVSSEAKASSRRSVRRARRSAPPPSSLMISRMATGCIDSWAIALRLRRVTAAMQVIHGRGV